MDKLKKLGIDLDYYLGKEYSIIQSGENNLWKYQSWTNKTGIPFLVVFNVNDNTYKFSHHVGEGCFVVSKTHLDYTIRDNFLHFIEVFKRAVEQYYWKGNYKKDVKE